MKCDKNYCINSFLQFRYIYGNYCFKKGLLPNYHNIKKSYKILDAKDLDTKIKEYIKNNVDDKTVLMLSGGIDSAILASYMPKGSKTFTLKCIASKPTIDETATAKKIAEYNGLEHEIVEVTWDDYIKYSEELLKNKKAPFHSIEVQIYKACLKAKKQGYTKLLFGESADAVFGGLDGLLSKDWSLDEFIERFNFVNPEKVLEESKIITKPYEDCLNNNKIEVQKYISKWFFQESVNSYINACNTAKITFLSPFVEMKMKKPLDLKRIRNGENKYIIRELYKMKYPNFPIPEKTPMPRPIDLWLENWKGPTRKEFKKNCILELKGDEKWLVYILEKFLNYYEIEE